MKKKDNYLQELAQNALRAYLRSVFLQPARDIFDVSKLPVAEFALSLGLPSAPKLRFLKRSQQACPGSHCMLWPGVKAQGSDFLQTQCLTLMVMALWRGSLAV